MIVKLQPADIVLEDLTDDQVTGTLRDRIIPLLETRSDSLNSHADGVKPQYRGEKKFSELIDREVVVDFVGFPVIPQKVTGEIEGALNPVQFLAEPDFDTVEYINLTTTRITFRVVNGGLK